MDGLDSFKERIKIFLAVFQYGVTFFIGISVSLITYIGKKAELKIRQSEIFSRTGQSASIELPNPDIILWTHVTFLILVGAISIYFVIEADKVADTIVERERIKEAEQDGIT